jgi:phosphomannomutase
MNIDPELAEQVASWLAQDPDPVTREELTQLWQAAQSETNALTELKDAFRAPLEFGTAGLRGALGPGPNRMNRVTVLQAAAGLASYLVEQGFAGKPVTIGFDARYNSEIFARDTAEVMAGAGLVPMLFSRVVPTPVLAFSIRNQEACAGVMVTASHNPPQDNGYKVYLGDGRQIVSPADTDISNHIRSITDVRNISRSTTISLIDKKVVDDYVACTTALINLGPTSVLERSSIKCVYTALHGVGWETLCDATKAAGFKEPVAVVEQRDPDPAFPTVAFPNPEEKGALDLAMELAANSGADLLLANDPDADRLAVALVDVTGAWRALRGDQVGTLLGWWVIERAKLTNHEVSGTFANSIVSSMMLEQIARAKNLQYENTLTGFKWVSRVSHLIYGYEEALGYCVDPHNVSDKDGISAALMFLELMAYLNTVEKSAWDVLGELSLLHGLHATDQVSIRVTDLTQLTEVMTALRSNPPQTLGGLKVNQVDDLSQGFADLPKTDAVIIHLSGASEIEKARVIIRPSGTEPKIKCYLEVVVRHNDLVIAQATADNELQELARDAQPLLVGGN